MPLARLCWLTYARRTPARVYTPQQLAALETLAGQASLALHRAGLEEERARLAERLRALNELVRIAVSRLDMAEVVDRVAEQVKQLIAHDQSEHRVASSRSGLRGHLCAGY